MNSKIHRKEKALGLTILNYFAHLALKSRGG